MNSGHKPKKLGRPFLPPDEKQVIGTIRLNDHLWAQFRALGGVVWLRDAIKRATARRAAQKEREPAGSLD